MYYFLDLSKSLAFHAPACNNANHLNAPKNTACWLLFLEFVKSLSESLALVRNLGWNEGLSETSGLRIFIYAFHCPKTAAVAINIGGTIQSYPQLLAAIDTASSFVPSGSTCPGLSIEDAAFNIQSLNNILRPSAAIILTDGVFHDPEYKYAMQALSHYQVVTFALAIALGSNVLTPSQILTQKTQLLNFVSGDPNRIFNLDRNGLTLLPMVGEKIIGILEAKLFAHGQASFFNRTVPGPFCGWSTKKMCLSANEGQSCKWNYDPNAISAQFTACNFRSYCGYTSSYRCGTDEYCFWNGTCNYNYAF